MEPEEWYGTVNYVEVEPACILKLDEWKRYTGKTENGTENGDEKEDATDESYGITCMIERAYYMKIELAYPCNETGWSDLS